MAKKKNDFSFFNTKVTNTFANRIQKDLDTAYKNTYYTDNDNDKNIENIRKKIDQDINNLIDKTRLRNNGNNISDLYARTMASNDSDMFKDFKHALQDETMLADLMDVYSQNSIQRDLDREIDVICKYVPKLNKALDIKLKHVLTADHFNNDNIQIELVNNEGDKNNDTALIQNSPKDDIESFKKKYELTKLAKKIYKKTAKYGETMIYVISYNKALQRLLNKSKSSGPITEAYIDNIVKNNSKKLNIVYNVNALNESSSYNENDLVYDMDDIKNSNTADFIQKSDDYDKLEIEYNALGVIPSIIQEYTTYEKYRDSINAIHEEDRKSFLTNSNYIDKMNKEFKKFAKGEKYTDPDKLNADGFTNINSKEFKEEQINIPGCIVKELDHTMIKKLVVNEICLGYMYIECDRNLTEGVQTTFSSTLGGLRPRRSTVDRENVVKSPMDNQALEKISKMIASKIDAKFINTNQELAKEIYGILKYNEDHSNGKVSRIRVSFIPPEDIVHSYFDINEKTNRGISDLHLALFPAKLLSCLYISNTIALLTRGYDKRAYYVKQTVDTNTYGVLLNVINQIKQSNFNLRQIENMNNIMNITGRFNDYVIPQSPSGESPISFEVIPGQNIEIKTEFMNMLEQMAITLTGVTPDMIESTEQVQTATHITMTNNRFLIDIFERQTVFQEILSLLYTKIYQIEYNTNDELEVKLPPPVMLNFTNTSQILTVGNELIQNILIMKLGQENPQAQEKDILLRSSFTGKLMEYYFKSFLPLEDIDKLLDESKTEVAYNMKDQSQEQQGNMM